MPLPLIPIGVLWIVAAAATIGILAGIIAFFITSEGTTAILFIGAGFIAVLLIPLLPNRYQWVRDLKKKLRYALSDDTES